MVEFDMLGVVLWSDASDGKAVIWCEDQGDLAYVSGSDGILRGDDFFDAGDLVQFDMKIHQSLRFASNPRLVIEKAATDLPHALLEGARTPPPETDVIPFSSFVRRDERDEACVPG